MTFCYFCFAIPQTACYTIGRVIVMNWYIGVDIGTTNIKAAAYCPDRSDPPNMLLHESEPTPKTYPSGTEIYEYDADALFETCVRVLARLTARLEHPHIRAIAVSSMAESGVLLDRENRPLSTSIAWFDPRTLPQAEALSAMLGREHIYKITGQLCSNKFGITKLLWYRQNRPELFAGAQHWLSINDYMLYRLSGELVCDYSIASRTMAFDIRALRWSDELLSAAQLPRSMFPQAVPGATKVGTLRPEITAALGLHEPPAVVTGGHDHACAAVGAGTIVPGSVLDSMGTSEVAVFPIDRAITSPTLYAAQANIYPHCSDTLYRVLTSIQACGASMNWFLATLGSEIAKEAAAAGIDAYTRLQEVAEACRECPDLQYYPFLRGSQKHPDAGGVFFGFHDCHTTAHFSKALLDGLCCEFFYQTSLLTSALGQDVKTITAVGGPTRSSYLMQRKATISGVEMRCPDCQESAAFGAALLGSVGCGDQTFSQIRQIASGLPARVWHPCTNEQIETAKRTYCARRDMIDQCFHYR